MKSVHGLADTRTASGYIPILLLVGGAINGFAVRIMESIRIHGGETLLFGISPFEVIAVLVGATFLSQAINDDRHHVGWPEGLTLIALLVPSSAVSWAAIAGYSGLLAWKSAGDRRAGAALFFGLAVTGLWGAVGIKWFAGPITAIEAQVVTALLSPFREDVTVSQNLMGLVGGHQILLLPACASAYLLPKAILGFAAVTLFMGTAKTMRSLFVIGVVTATVLALANWMRLAWMTWSHYDYTIAHGPIGANAFDLLQTAIIVGAGLWASR